MKTIKIVIGRFLYFFASKLPESWTKIQIGQKAIRALCGKLILEKCGKNVNIEKGAIFPSSVELGDNSGIGTNARINGKVIIGNDVMMGANVSIFSRNHKFSDINIPMNQQGFTEELPVIIGNDVLIGANVIILPGVKIGTGSVVGAGDVVTKDVEEYTVVGGNPAAVLKRRN